MVKGRKPSPRQVEALKMVERGCVEFGSEYPERDRRAVASGGHAGLHTFLLDGYAPYGSQRSTLPALEERGWVVVRHDEVPTRHVAAHSREHRSISGFTTQIEIHAHDAPADAGWRARVELTPEGVAVLDESAPSRVCVSPEATA